MDQNIKFPEASKLENILLVTGEMILYASLTYPLTFQSPQPSDRFYVACGVALSLLVGGAGAIKTISRNREYTRQLREYQTKSSDSSTVVRKVN